MLNGFCNKNLFLDCNTNTKKTFICPDKHFSVGFFHERSIKIYYEEIWIENHCLMFYSDGFEHIKYDNNSHPIHGSLIDIRDSNLSFKDLDSIEKIEEFTRNYYILC